MKELSRRSFLKGAAATALSAAFVGLSGQTVASADDGVIFTGSLLEGANQLVGNGPFTPGTYTAEATGMGKVIMTATFSETAITDITLDVSGETPGIGLDAAPTLIQQALEAQSSEIQGVSGASLPEQRDRPGGRHGSQRRGGSPRSRGERPLV